MVSKKALFHTFSIGAFLLLSVSASAQVPGYMGKRVYGGYNLGLSPVIEYLQFERIDDPKLVRVKHEIFAEGVLTRSMVVGAKMTFAGSRFSTRSNPDNQLLRARLSTVGFGLTTKFFLFKTQGNIAPLGNYIGLELGRASTKIFDLASPSSDFDSRFTGNYFSFGFGKQHIIKDLLMMNYGMNLGFSFSKKDHEISKFSDLYWVNRQMFVYAFSVTLGLGIIP